MNSSVVTKQLANLSLDSQKKSPGPTEFIPGRNSCLTSSNSSSPNLFNNSYHSQENVGGTTYFYLGNMSDTLTSEEGTSEIVRKTKRILVGKKKLFYINFLITIGGKSWSWTIRLRLSRNTISSSSS